ncbi:BCCT family transporter [Haloarchaeobius sp. HME9146]|uniref:BCCT family transporter n=1 Tax=Haloarchaeobius sp. HME9146 TaxID=2978732 RepID=UPI0021BDF3A5|nr:BCCT family transporter [Haloarchaeobius sp. HME9146]MCT9095243.1 BCCT family transporter [Haloarchaeobius sp. HME9146]
MPERDEVNSVFFFVVVLGVVSGAFVVAAFLLPTIVGALVSGRALLALSLTFVGCGLSGLAMLPADGRLASLGTPRVPEQRLSLDRFREGVDPGTFVVGASLPFLAVLVLLTERLVTTGSGSPTTAAVGTVTATVLDTGGPFFHGSIVLFVGFVAVAVLGPWGRIRLGGRDATPQYSVWSLFAMVFSAGIAAGIVFWGPAEAVTHFAAVPPFVDAPPQSPAAAVGAVEYTLFHWGFSAWSTYLALGLPIAYFAHNRDAPLRVSSVLVPVLGDDAIDYPVGRLVDVLAVFATIGGVATTLGFVSDQFLTGIEYRWGVELGSVETLVLVVGFTTIFTVSAATGIDRGIRRISRVNVAVFATLLCGLLVVGPTETVLGTGARATGRYALDFLSLSLFLGDGSGWVSGWTTFYWAWWLSWAPFVGLFVARVSRGHRIRTVVATCVGATTAATLAWFVVLGGTAIGLQRSGAADVVGVVAASSEAVAGFPVFDAVPFGGILVALFLLLVITFFVTSGDTSTLGVALLTTRTVEPPVAVRVFWGVSQGVVAAVLMLVGGASTLQSAAILTGGPFAVIGVVAVVGLAATLVGGSDRTEQAGVPDSSVEE